WERAVRYTAQVADGLRAVHAKGLLHRDIKPVNILWDREDDAAVLGDFGLATRAGGPPGLAGTPGYLAPELLEEPASVKSDVFALAATLYHLLTGAPRFDAKDPYASLVQARAGLPRPLPALDGQPAGVEEVLRAGLEPDPRRRPDPDAFLAELRHVRVLGLVKVMVRNAQNTACPVRLDVTVSTADAGDKVYREQLRCRGGEPARVVRCRTGDLLRVEAAADADGYLTVLNFSS